MAENQSMNKGVKREGLVFKSNQRDFSSKLFPTHIYYIRRVNLMNKILLAVVALSLAGCSKPGPC